MKYTPTEQAALAKGLSRNLGVDFTEALKAIDETFGNQRSSHTPQDGTAGKL